MKVLHVVPTYLPAVRYGGPIRSVHGLCKALRFCGVDAEVFTTNVDGPGVSDVPLETKVDVDGVPVTYFGCGLGRRIYRSPAMRRSLARGAAAFDVIHAHSVFLWPTFAAARAAREAGRPYVISPRGMLVEDLIRRRSRLVKRAWIECFERANLRHAAAIHATSDIESAEIRKLGLGGGAVRVVPNGVDIPAAQPPSGRVDDMFKKAAEKPFVLFLGRINWKKGIDVLIPAMRDIPSFNLVIAGNDEENYVPELRRIAERHGLLSRVFFVGPAYADAKDYLLYRASLFALPSHSENFGNAAAEAMAAGRPVLVTPDVGIAAIVRERECGIVVERESGAIGAAMNRLLADDSELGRMGLNARRAAQEILGWKAVAERMKALYESLLSGTNRL